MTNWNLPTELELISNKNEKEWRKQVLASAEIINRTKLREECMARSRGESTAKTKTKSIIAKLDHSEYKREPNKFSITNNTLAVSTMIMGR